ncbi:MAG: GNAT family N-acetyltransferase [Candidatus Micrarchaeota archaeon]
MLISGNTRSGSGSIGAGPLTYDARNNRIKGFAAYKLGSEGAVLKLKNEIKDAEGRHPASERTTVRAMVSKKMLRELEIHPNGLGRVEAVVNIDNVDLDYALVYFGRSKEMRKSPDEIVKEEKNSIKQIQKIKPTTREAANQRLQNGGYGVRVVEDMNDELVRELVSLYQRTYSQYTFELSEQTIREMNKGSNKMLVTFSENGDVAGAMVAEHAKVRIEDTVLELYELSDYATSRKHRGHGIMTAMQIEAINILRKQDNGGQAVIYSENRAPWTPVSISSHKTGLMEYAGTLDKHCMIESDRNIAERGNFENLHVFVANGW